MKINWGTGIVLAFIGFIGFILFFVVRMSMESNASHELVTEDYYKQTLAYQEEINAQNNARDNKAQLTTKRLDGGIQLSFPEQYEPKKITGTVSLYRPSNEHLDFDLPISLSNAHLLIPDKRLLDGRWDISVSWEYEGKKYLHKDKITY
ncbi:FixH family protein [Maribacter sp. 2307ULW6-5]|uniref:FixH family protein n=1 Tax=Maribacter sp. 2307ULW6-5 TaxID=3386275 RepID=UPI0039BD8A71